MQEEKNQFQNWLVFFFDVLIYLTKLNSIKETNRKSVIHQKLSENEKLFYLQIYIFPETEVLKILLLIQCTNFISLTKIEKIKFQMKIFMKMFENSALPN